MLIIVSFQKKKNPDENLTATSGLSVHCRCRLHSLHTLLMLNILTEMKAYEIHAYCNTDMHATLIVTNVCVITFLLHLNSQFLPIL